MPIFYDASLTTKMKIARRLGEHDKVQALLVKMQNKNPRSQGLMALEELGLKAISIQETQKNLLSILAKL